jgi:hypothetical protein
MGSTPIYNIPFAEPSDLVRDWPALSEDVALAIEAALEGIPVKEKRVERFTTSGTWTVPAGVTYAVANILGGGGGGGGRTSSTSVGGSKGSASSVAFASGTVTANGGEGGGGTTSLFTETGIAGEPNSGNGGGQIRDTAGSVGALANTGQRSGVKIVAGAAVTPAASITVTVGSGGAGGGTTAVGGAGGSGYVWIEYFVEV